MPPMQRAIIKAAPVWLRSRIRAISRLRRGTARVDVRASVFCTVRERVPHALCGFYAAAFTRLLALFDIGASAEVIACRGTGEATCVLNVSLTNGQPAASAPAEAL
jgi:predicted hydrocarbon binding protein